MAQIVTAAGSARRRPPNAARFALLGFAGAILVGAAVLMLPACSEGDPLGPVDALFTATSAVCVTGLVVVDTGAALTPLGQTVVLLLIQIGGIGIMTVSAFALLLLGRRSSLPMSETVQGKFLRRGQYRISAMLRRTILFTLVFESAGAALLWLRWGGAGAPGVTVWPAVFHSVSAFCNAGFSLYSDSLERFGGDPVTNIVVMALIVAGGVGFFVLSDLGAALRRRHGRRLGRLSFHTRIVLLISALLIVAGALSFLLLERPRNLAGIPLHDAALRALFQSVTARTAGFNTMDVGTLSNASLFVMIFLMFFGGAPGSMAGGVKVTTLGVILVVVVSRLKGARHPALFGRTLSRSNLERALALFFIAVTLVALATLLLQITEIGAVPHPESRGQFLDLAFECVSAFGTVGLSTGVTPQLSAAGRLIVTLVMFIGRLGPLTLVLGMSRRRRAPEYRYPEEELMIG